MSKALPVFSLNRFLEHGSALLIVANIPIFCYTITMPRSKIGTSGWNYPHWKGIFYPVGLSQRKWLEYYTKFFNAVEINVTFYRSIEEKIYRGWREKAPGGFRFFVKGPRFITHIKRLKGVSGPLKLFINNASCLEDKLGGCLWQLPPGFKKDIIRLEAFIKLLARTNLRHTIEFRNRTWFDEETYSLLRKYNICLCIAHSSRFPCVKAVTADFLYLRFHGSDRIYGSNYSEAQLRSWAVLTKKIAKSRDILAFFNNDACGYAVNNALKFKELLIR